MKTKIFKIVFALTLAITGAFNYATFAQQQQCTPDPTVWASDATLHKAWTCPKFFKIGVGTVVPSAQFHIFRELFAEDGDFFLIQKEFGSSLLNLFVIKEDGKTGVGTNAPSSILSVSGDFDVNTFGLYVGSNKLVGVGTRNPQKALHIFTRHELPCILTPELCSHEGLRLENLTSQEGGGSKSSVWDIEPTILGVTPLSSSLSILRIGPPGAPVITMTEEGNLDVRGNVNADDFFIRGVRMGTWTSSGNDIYYDAGIVGVGAPPNPNTYEALNRLKLDVKGDIRVYSTDENNYLRMAYNSENAIIDNFGKGSLLINNYSGKDVAINGNVSIGYGEVKTGTRNLTVCGFVKAKEVIVESGWCDFVFEDDYKQMTWEEKEKYYKEKKHLVGIASVQEIEENGLNMGETMKGMIQNIEENSLDIIELYKKIERFEKEKAEWEKEKMELIKRIEALENK